MADPFFAFFFGLAEKRVWSGLQSLLVLAPPTMVGDVNEKNVIYYCFIVTCAISLVMYKHVFYWRLMIVKMDVKSAIAMADAKMGFRPFSDKQVNLLGELVE